MGTKAAVLTSGPIGFTDSSGGQLSIPGSAIHFDDKGFVQADHQWPLYEANKSIIDAWLPHLAQVGVILPAPTVPSAPAEGGTTLAVPAPGTITLSGGADATSAVPASATVAANS